MAETDTEWTQLLDNMTKLEALSETASEGAKKVSGWRSRMVSMVSSMTEKLKAIQSKINTIKDQGNKFNSETLVFHKSTKTHKIIKNTIIK